MVGDVVVVACGVQFDESFSIVCVLSEMLNDVDKEVNNVLLKRVRSVGRRNEKGREHTGLEEQDAPPSQGKGDGTRVVGKENSVDQRSDGID